MHELTHCLMYQLSGTEETWRRKQIPIWFREGMASFTALQAGRWTTLESLARHYEAPEAKDPVGDADALYASESELVYGAAHHAFAFLVRRYGDASVRALLEKMRGGLTFDEAFDASLPVSSTAFVAEFQRYVRLRGFRLGRLRGPAHPASPPNAFEAADAGPLP